MSQLNHSEPLPTVTKLLEFDAGHRLLNHEGKCRNVHGHRYRCELTCKAATLDEVGRIVDFSVVKRVVGSWLDIALDHGFVVQEGDPLIPALEMEGMKMLVLPFPSTAEHLVRYIAEKANSLLRPHKVEVVHVRLWETPTCYATWRSA